MSNKIIVSVLFFLIVFSPFTEAGLSPTAPWPMFRHDPQHTGCSPYFGPDSLCLKWKIQTGGPVQSSPAVGDRDDAGFYMIYVGSNDNWIYAIEDRGYNSFAYDQWVSDPSQPNPSAPFRSSPAIGDEWSDLSLYVGSDDNLLWNMMHISGSAISLPYSGGVYWRFGTYGAVESSPVVDTHSSDPNLTYYDEIYVGSNDGYIYAIYPWFLPSPFRWRFQTGGAVRSSPAIWDDVGLYVGSDDYNVYYLDYWSTPPSSEIYPTGGPVRSSPAIGQILADYPVYVGSDDFNVYCLKYQNAIFSLVWDYQTGSPVRSSPAIADLDGDNIIEVVIGSNDGNVYCFEGESITGTGVVKWSYPTGGPVESSPAIDASGRVYIGSDDEYVYMLNGLSGALISRYKTDGAVKSSPAIGPDSTIYVGSDDGYIYALGLYLPDLVIIGMTISNPNPIAGDSVVVTTFVQNQGNVVAGPCSLDFYYNLPSQPGFIRGDQRIFVPGLAPGAITNCVTDSFTTFTSYMQAWNSWARVDTDNLVKERDETNNTYGPFVIYWTGIIPPGPPVDLFAIGGETSVTLTWTNPITDIEGGELENLIGVIIYRNENPVDSVFTTEPGAECEYEDVDLEAGKYTYYLTAFNDDGEGPSSDTVEVWVGCILEAVANGGFEDWIDDEPIHWTVDQGCVIHQESPGHSGDFYVRLGGDRSVWQYGYDKSAWIYQNVCISPEQPYRFGFWAKGNNAWDPWHVYAWVKWLDAGQDQISREQIVIHDGATNGLQDWTEFGPFYIQTPAGAVFAKVEFKRSSWGHLDIDDVHFIHTPECVGGERGDADGDGSCNVLDALMAVNIILGTYQPTEDEYCRADCNADGVVNILDVIGIINKILGIGDCPP